MSYGAAMCLLRGRAYAGLDNRARAAAWFRAALRADPFCHEAFQARSNLPALVDLHGAEGSGQPRAHGRLVPHCPAR